MCLCHEPNYFLFFDHPVESLKKNPILNHKKMS